mmetsp:Transcript_27786/g.39448  ORF Transcript_27786/g.39448 Transcript_27786/m.39448 type:complete len:286 (+) Transcript_27786:107-964(+)
MIGWSLNSQSIETIMSSIEKAIVMIMESIITVRCSISGSMSRSRTFILAWEKYRHARDQYRKILSTRKVVMLDEYDYIFVAQKFNWDCGIACCSMVLKWFDTLIFNDHPLYKLLTPLWTVELYCYLKGLNINCLMCTRFVGVSPSHKHIAWYNQNYTDTELDRVSECFRTARRMEWDILQDEISIQDIAKFVGNDYNIAIILVDSETLTFRNRGVSYAGHYIVLLGFHEDSNTFLYLNPADTTGLKSVSINLLDLARSHDGTDGDIILCSKSNLPWPIIFPPCAI